MLTQTELLKSIEARIETLAKAERVTKNALSILSRDLVMYIGVMKSPDIGAVNRLLDVLTPRNRIASVLFFKHFIPHSYDDGTGQFGAMIKGEKKIAKKYASCIEFLEDEKNDIWTWADQNIEEKAPTPFSDRIQAIVKQALNGTKKQEAIPVEEVLQAVIMAGVSSEQVVGVFSQQQATTSPEEVAMAAE